MPLNAYLVFNGNCRQAVEYYADVFGTEKPQIMTFGDMPSDPNQPLSEEAKNLVMHANVVIDGSMLMFSDTFPGSPFVQGNNINLTYSSYNVDDVKNVFHKLKEGGQITMELQETFWSKSYGQLVDKFGIHWQLNANSEEM